MSIDDYLKQNPRYKLVFTQNEPDGFEFTNLGFEMAAKLDDQTLPSVVATGAFESVVAKGMQVHPEYGKYIAIKNIGMLFEPTLRLNVKMLFESISHDSLLLVCSDDIVQNDTFCFMNSSEGFDISPKIRYRENHPRPNKRNADGHIRYLKS